MIVAIINQTVPVGIVKVNTFVIAVDEAAGVTQFIGFHPTFNPADWLGFDSGFTPDADGVPSAAPGFQWAYDFGTPGLVQEPAPAAIPGTPFNGVPMFFGADQPAAGVDEYYVTNGRADNGTSRLRHCRN